MDTAAQAKKIKRVLRKTPKTGAEIAKEIGYDGGGRAVGKTLASLVKSKDAKKVAGRPPKYAKA